MKPVRCAIYTRKSSEDGLEQDFNSLHAQREACAAYVLSQASEGWTLLPDEYDDGGLSGGTLARTALQRLMTDVAAGKVDIIVIYKLDRLTRSLLDFAQFEREVTAERIRDKIAASKAKGMWMGGIPPLGYRPHGRTLLVVEEQAALVRTIFERYVQLGNVRLLATSLMADGLGCPRRKMITGRAYGGGPFRRSQIYNILRNPIYTGRITHHGELYQGQHPAIIAAPQWEAVQRQLAGRVRGMRTNVQPAASFLTGRLVDGSG